MNELETLAPVVAVQGNVEREEVVMKLSIKREIMIGHCRIGIVHILGNAHNRVKVARQDFPYARVVVFGHSHIPWNEDVDGQLLFNPGSATDRRRQPMCSIGLLHIDDQTQSVRGDIFVPAKYELRRGSYLLIRIPVSVRERSRYCQLYRTVLYIGGDTYTFSHVKSATHSPNTEEPSWGKNQWSSCCSLGGASAS